jgi:hypothetical protein
MAMNKREQQAFADLEQRLRLARAFNWTTKPEPDVEPPADYSQKPSVGWTYNAHAQRIEQAWSKSSTHGNGSPPLKNDFGSGYQGSLRLYSTKLLALRACRADMELKFAEELAKIDKQIEAEERT